MSARPTLVILHVARNAAFRTVLFLIFWLMISGWSATDFPVGLVSAVAASWASLHLLPVAKVELQTTELVKLVLNFAVQSIISGAAVAQQALRQPLQLRPGYVSYRAHLPPGAARTTFCALSSLLPGTLPTGIDESGALLIHCLDVKEPVSANLAAEEARFIRVLAHD